jgi:Ca-activated chloride channel family protein
MAVYEKLTQARQGAIRFAEDAFKKHYAVGLVAFDSDARLLVGCTVSQAAFAEGTKSLSASGSTDMLSGLTIAHKELDSHAGLRAIVVATDGYPDDAAATLAEAERIKAKGIDIIAVGTTDADAAFLRRLASRSDLAAVVENRSLEAGISSAARLLKGPTSE